jgi:membrane-bound metal-dependent hydrolase YbcI (DUF457 family)
VVYKKKTIPYFVALLSHSLIGDIFSGGIQLFWPFSRDMIFVSQLTGTGIISASMELSLFIICTAVMVINKDFQKLLSSKTNRMYWLIPLGSVLGPLLINVRGYNSLPLLLVTPTLFYIAVFSYVIIGPTIRNLMTKNN